MPESIPAKTPKPWRWRLLAALLILSVAGLHLAYLALDCPLDLAPDEAHYWDWSRPEHLDWSYYSKGPLVAYLIRGSCLLAGPWARALTGTETFAVRLPAVICGSLLLLSLYILTRQVYRDERLAVVVVALALTLPMLTAVSSLMTIDAPYTCCWGWALVLAYQAVFRRSAWAWPVAGLVVGIGILAKYTMVLFLPSVGLFLLTSPAHRQLLRQRGFWVMTGVALVCCLPIAIWNAQHEWVTLRHVLTLAGLGHTTVTTGPRIRWFGPFVYLGAQCALLLVFWFLAWLVAMIVHRPWVEPQAGVRYLWWMSAPMFMVFLLFSLKTGGGEANWPVTAYISGLVLTVARLYYVLPTTRPDWYRRFAIASLALVCTVGVGLSVLIHHSEWVLPWVAELVGPATKDNALPLRRVDPTCRLRGWRMLAGEVDLLREKVRDREGLEPLVAGSGWSLPGELGFYCAGQPTVYSLGLALGDRHSQYDFWRPNPTIDVEAFVGRTFIVVGALDAQLALAFEAVEPTQMVMHRECGQPVSYWAVTVCHGFRGFPASTGPVKH